jgi:hypothetical protein
MLDKTNSGFITTLICDSLKYDFQSNLYDKFLLFITDGKYILKHTSNFILEFIRGEFMDMQKLIVNVVHGINSIQNMYPLIAPSPELVNNR